MKLFIFWLGVSNSKCDVILRNSVSQLDFVTREFRTSWITYFIWFMTSYTMRGTSVRSRRARNYVCTTFSWTFCEEHGLSLTRNPNLSSPEYMWQGEISVCKVAVLIKVMLVKNDYFLHPKFELHRYFGFLYQFWPKKHGASTSHELIVWLIPTWIRYDLLTVSQIWPSNHQLSYFFWFCQFKVA